LCEELLEPLICYFWGGSASAFGYRSKELNQICNEKGHNCGKDNAASHTWDELKSEKMGAMACIVVHWYLDLYEETGDFRPLTWYIHDHLPYSSMSFFPKLCAFNIGWYEKPTREIFSYIEPKGFLTRQGMDNHQGDHSQWYQDFPKLNI
jgi:hypothetical protein